TAFAAAFEQLEPLAKMTGVSLPPPPPSSAAEDPIDPGSMVAAGVPSKGSLRLKLGGAALVASVLAGTLALLAIDLEREPAAQGAKLTAGANITGAGRDAIPAPPAPDETSASAPAPAPVDARDLPP